jgi:hypothetical protein
MAFLFQGAFGKGSAEKEEEEIQWKFNALEKELKAAKRTIEELSHAVEVDKLSSPLTTRGLSSSPREANF